MAYDIRDPSRLRRVAKSMEGHGLRVQYSVLVCDLTMAERLDLWQELEAVVDTMVDSIACVELGERDETRWTFIGPAPQFPRPGATIL